MKYLILAGLLACVTVVFAGDDDQTMALKYLNQYHYISPSRSGNHDVKTAIMNFQQFAGLPVTGEIDDATVRQMKMPRCGMPDVEDSGLRVRRFKTGSKWSKLRLTYHIQYGADLPQSTQDSVFAKALQYWADVSGLSFSRTRNGRDADIKISFGPNSHGGSSDKEGTCAYPFDGPSGVLAHAFFPSNGRAHFDEDEKFTDGTKDGTNLLWVATHEFGHSLGLYHSDVRNAVMYPYYTGYKPGFGLQADDVAGIRSLYGDGSGGGGGGGKSCKAWTVQAPLKQTTTSLTLQLVCEDTNTGCPSWKSYCGRNDYVNKHCKKTCGTC